MAEVPASGRVVRVAGSIVDGCVGSNPSCGLHRHLEGLSNCRGNSPSRFLKYES
jgi:hypothetical protein